MAHFLNYIVSHIRYIYILIYTLLTAILVIMGGYLFWMHHHK